MSPSQNAPIRRRHLLEFSHALASFVSVIVFGRTCTVKAFDHRHTSQSEGFAARALQCCAPVRTFRAAVAFHSLVTVGFFGPGDTVDCCSLPSLQAPTRSHQRQYQQQPPTPTPHCRSSLSLHPRLLPPPTPPPPPSHSLVCVCKCV